VACQAAARGVMRLDASARLPPNIDLYRFSRALLPVAMPAARLSGFRPRSQRGFAQTVVRRAFASNA
jgi:hypothetical protein